MNTLTRWLRHLWLDAKAAERAITKPGLKRLEQAVADSEARHLGELRLCVEGGLPLPLLLRRVSPRARALDLFSHLRVWDTEHNNGVLIYLLLAERRIEILADRGLHAHVSAEYWGKLSQQLSAHLRQGHVEQGLMEALLSVGALLKAHYPAGQQSNTNELPNAVVLL
ncbi:TPM domain-containing protein [Aquabacterium sp.]|uniref:TPM domain-containing protein n=1 Tax=Aquabacterium sp. TaxID=1872578 RepID=UPI0035B1672D